MSKSFVKPVSRSLFLTIPGLLLVLLFTLAACGDSGSSSASTGSNSSSTNTGGAPGKTITIKENHPSSGDVYFFDQTKLTVKKGETVTIKNESDEPQDVSEGDASQAGISVTVGINRSDTVTFNIPGTFNIKTNKGAAITVVVQ